MASNIEQLKVLAEIFDTDKIITSDEIEAVLRGVLQIMASFKADNIKLNKETTFVVDNLFEKILAEQEKLKENITRETSDTKDEVIAKLEASLKEIKSLMKEVTVMKPKDGQDGKDADEKIIVGKVLEQIKLPESKVLTGEAIIDSINALSLVPENQIDATRIKNLPKQQSVVGGVIARNVYQLGDVSLTSLANSNVLKYNSTNRIWENSALKTINGASLLGSGDVVIDATVTLLDLSANSTTAPTSIYNMSAGVPVLYKSSDGNTILALDETNERIGIGTASPSGKLHLSGNTLVDSWMSDTGAALDTKSWSWQVGSAVGTGVLRLRALNDAATNGINAIEFTRTGIASISTAIMGGNLGVGASSPGARLDVVRTGNTGNQIRTIDSEGASAAIRTYSTADGDGLILNQYYAVGGSPYLRNADFVASMSDASATQMRFFTKNLSSNPAVAMVIDKAGKVGIGTSSPAQILEIAAAAGTTGATAPTLRISNTDNIDYTVGSPIGAVEFYSAESSGTAFPGVGASIKAVVESAAGHEVGLAFSTAFQDTNATEYMRISSTGRVGIGTTAPIAKLGIGTSTVVTDYGSVSIKQSGDTNGFVTQASTNDAWLALYHTGTIAVLRSDYQTSAGYKPLTFWTSNVEKMRLDTSGNLGIGVTPVSAKLHVEDSGALIRFSRATLNAFTVAVTGVLSGTGAGDLVYDTVQADGGFAWRINSGGTLALGILETGQVSVFTTTASTSTTTGSLINAGGFGNAGAMYVGGAAAFASTLVVGTTSATSTNSVGVPQITAESDLYSSLASITHNNTDGNYGYLLLGKSRGTKASPLIIADTDRLGSLDFVAYDGATYRSSAQIVGIIDGTPGLSDLPTGLSFRVSADGSATPGQKMYLSPAGNLTLSATTTSTSSTTGSLINAGGLGNAGAGYFGDDVTTTGSASRYFRATAVNNNALAGSVYTTGNGASLQTWQVASNASGASGEFTIRDSTAGVTYLTITKATGLVTLAGDLTVSGGNIFIGSSTVGGAATPKVVVVAANGDYGVGFQGSSNGAIRSGIKHTITATLGGLDFMVGGDNNTDASVTALSLSSAGVLTTSSTIELGHASDTTLSRSAAGVLAVEGVVIPSISSTNTLTNKRITERVVTAADDATAVIDIDVTDQYQLTAMANATTISTTGTPTAGQKLVIRLKDNGTGRALTWDAVFRAIGVTLPTTTVANKTHYIGCIYNLTDTKWDAVSVASEA